MQILKALPVVVALAVAFGLGACANKANLEVTGDDSVSAAARGNSAIACNARKMLSVAYSGASKIGYKGNPRIEMNGKRGLYRIEE